MPKPILRKKSRYEHPGKVVQLPFTKEDLERVKLKLAEEMGEDKYDPFDLSDNAV